MMGGTCPNRELRCLMLTLPHPTAPQESLHLVFLPHGDLGHREGGAEHC